MQSEENTSGAVLEARVWFPIVLLLSIALRCFLPFSASFPINDGGLFYRMALDLEANGFRIPAFTSYNLSNIPFAYPPLGIYLLAIGHKVLVLDLFDILRVVPPIASCLTLWPAWLIIRELVPSLSGRVAAFAIFGLRFVTYDWLIMGGGITRAPGLLFGLLALAFFLQAKRTTSFKLLCIAGVMGALAVLSHPLMSSVMMLSIACFAVCSSWKFSLRQTVGAIAIFLVIWLPWFFTIVQQHGISPFLQALGAGQMTTSTLFLPFWLVANGSVIFEAPTVLLLLLGILGCFVEKRFRILIWFLLLFEIPRLSFIHSALPVAIVCGLGFQLLVTLPIFADGSARVGRFDALNLVFALSLGILAGLSAIRTMELQDETMSAAELREIAWIREHTAANSKFFMVTPRRDQRDYLTEWFPALAERYSLRTFEGKEWLDHAELNEIYAVRYQLGKALENYPAELPTVLSNNLRKADYLLINRGMLDARFTAGLELTRELERNFLYHRVGADD